MAADDSWVKPCMEGRAVTVSTGGAISRALDFFVPGDRRVLFVTAYWWTYQWGRQAGLNVMNGALAPDAFGGWSVTRDDGATASISVPDDGHVRREITASRIATDVQRDAYVKALGNLSVSLSDGEFDIAPWVAAFQARPVVDVVALARQREAGMRSVATVLMRDQGGGRLGALAFDGNGNAAASGGDAWLASLASAYAGRSPPYPALDDFINWLAGQAPHGAYALGGQMVTDREGTVQEIADALASADLGSSRL